MPLRALLDQFAQDFPNFCKVGTGYNADIDYTATRFLAVTDSVPLLAHLEFDAIFVDEAHHPLARTFPKTCLLYRFSATHQDEPDFRYSMGQAMDDAVLCDYDLTVPLVTPLHGHTYLSLADLLLKQAGRFRRVLAYSNSIREARTFRMVLEKFGLASWHMNGGTRPKKRQEILEQFAGPLQKPVHVLVTVEVLGEGINIPNADTCMFVEPRGSYRSILQAIGRVLRPHLRKPLAHIVLPGVAMPYKSSALNGPAIAGGGSFSDDRGTLPVGGQDNRPKQAKAVNAYHPETELASYISCDANEHRRPSSTQNGVITPLSMAGSGADVHQQPKRARVPLVREGGSPVLPARANPARLRMVADPRQGTSLGLKPTNGRRANADMVRSATWKAPGTVDAPIEAANPSMLLAGGLSVAHPHCQQVMATLEGNKTREVVTVEEGDERQSTSSCRRTLSATGRAKQHASGARCSELQLLKVDSNLRMQLGREHCLPRRARLDVQVRAAAGDIALGLGSQLQRFLTALARADHRLSGLGSAPGHRIQIVDCTASCKSGLNMDTISQTIYAELAAILQSNDSPWQVRFSNLEQFAETQGRLPKEGASNFLERSLCSWMHAQAHRALTNSLLPHRLHRFLNSSSPLIRKRVQAWLDPGRQYRESCCKLRTHILEHGSLPRQTKTSDARRLASWLRSQFRFITTLPPWKAEMLEDVHPLVKARVQSSYQVLTLQNLTRFQERGLQVSKFVTRKGRLPHRHEGPDLMWLQAKRRQLRRGMMPAEFVLHLQRLHPIIVEYMQSPPGRKWLVDVQAA